MTTFTLVFAMIPLSLKLAPGAEARPPIAVVIIGGLLSSMLPALVVVPVVYTPLEDTFIWVRALRNLPRRLRRHVPPPRLTSRFQQRRCCLTMRNRWNMVGTYCHIWISLDVAVDWRVRKADLLKVDDIELDRDNTVAFDVQPELGLQIILYGQVKA